MNYYAIYCKRTKRSKFYPAWLPSRRFIAGVIAIGGMQLLATMDSTVAIVALPPCSKRPHARRNSIHRDTRWK